MPTKFHLLLELTQKSFWRLRVPPVGNAALQIVLPFDKVTTEAAFT
jgi:hypothetical protein